MAQLLRIRDWQRADDPARVLAAKREKPIFAAQMKMFRAIREAMGGDHVGNLLERHDLNGLMAVLRHPDVIASMNAGFAPIAETKTMAGAGAMAALTEKIRARIVRKAAEESLGALVPYDPLDQAAPLMAQRQRYIQAIIGDRAEVMQRSILNALRSGIDPRGVQIALQQVIGLTPRQAEAVANFRRLLEAGDRAALQRALRDPKFDAEVARAIANGDTLSKDRIDRMVERYAENQLANRAATIAETEAQQMAVTGIRDAYVDAINGGKLLDSEVVRRWQTAMDERVCAVCLSIPIMNPNGVGVMQPYLSIEGPIMFPTVHPRCRCSEEYETDLTRLSESPWPFNV